MSCSPRIQGQKVNCPPYMRGKIISLLVKGRILHRRSLLNEAIKIKAEGPTPGQKDGNDVDSIATRFDFLKDFFKMLAVRREMGEMARISRDSFAYKIGDPQI